jgi:hypothetical protein
LYDGPGNEASFVLIYPGEDVLTFKGMGRAGTLGAGLDEGGRDGDTAVHHAEKYCQTGQLAADLEGLPVEGDE